MELYQIGRFLDLDILAQNCEDAIVHRLNHNNIGILSIYKNKIYLYLPIDSIYLYVYLSICLSVYLSVWLPVSVFLLNSGIRS